jgi:urate oxidase
VRTEMSYGKGQVTFYRVYTSAMSDVVPIPESAFAGRNNTLFALSVDVEVFGNCFSSAYTHGNNSNLIATDTMKNFILRQALAFDGATLECFLAFVGQQFLSIYPRISTLRITGREQPFTAARVPEGDETFADSNVLFSRSHNDYSSAVLDIGHDGGCKRILAHQCSRAGLQLIKITGSSFSGFACDAYTTLLKQFDRPLFIYLDVSWKYGDVVQMISPDLSHYIAAEQVGDFVQVIFHQFCSKSIQHLIHEMGLQLMRRFPQMAEVSFVAQNRIWETACVSDTDPRVKVYTDPQPAYGVIKLTMIRGEHASGYVSS